MKKIKSIHQLKTEKKRLGQRQAELENVIRSNWSSLKEAVKPGNIAKEAFDNAAKNTAQAGGSGESIFKSTFSYGMALLGKKLAEKTEDKLNNFFSRRSKK